MSIILFSVKNEWFEVAVVGEDFEVFVNVLSSTNSVSFVEFIQVTSNVVVLIEFTRGECRFSSLDDFLSFPVSTESHAIEESFEEDVGVDSVW